MAKIRENSFLTVVKKCNIFLFHPCVSGKLKQKKLYLYSKFPLPNSRQFELSDRLIFYSGVQWGGWPNDSKVSKSHSCKTSSNWHGNQQTEEQKSNRNG